MISVREMTNEDIPRVSEVMCSCYRWLGKASGFTVGQLDFLVAERGSVETIKAESQSQIYLVACINETVVGVAAVKANELAKLFVDPDCHGQGAGAMLFNWAEQIITDAMFKEMIVGVMASSAIGFYKRMGMSLFDEKIPETGAFAGCKTPLMRKVLVHA